MASPGHMGGGATPSDHDFADWEDPLDEGHPDCRCDGDGMIVVCIDDMCRGSGGCGKFSDRTCYAVCSCGGW